MRRSAARERCAISGAALAAAAAWWGPAAAAHAPALARALAVPLRLDALAGAVALTFDDGPHPEGTPAVLTALEQAGATATFFLVGEQAARYPALVSDIIDAGHEAAVHGQLHRNQMRLTPRTLARDLRQAIGTIGDSSGRTPALYRPPYGAFTAPGIKVVRRACLQPLLWSRWGRDWSGRCSVGQIAALATRGLRAGDVILLHDADWYSAPQSHRLTAQALPPILGEIRAHGLRAVALSPALVSGASD